MIITSVLTIIASTLAPPHQDASLDGAVQMLHRGEVRCYAAGDGVLDYVGPSDTPLLECIQQQPGPIRRLVITSGGGDASETIRAAELLAAARPDVEVRGVCASSCANYIVPAAANLSIPPGSILALHGAAVHSEAYFRLLEDEVERQQRAQVPDVSDEVVRQGRAYIRGLAERLIVDQDRLAERLSIQTGWFSLETFTDEGFIAAPDAFAVPDPEFTRRELPRVNVVEHWYPETADERTIVSKMMDGARLSYVSKCSP